MLKTLFISGVPAYQAERIERKDGKIIGSNGGKVEWTVYEQEGEVYTLGEGEEFDLPGTEKPDPIITIQDELDFLTLQLLILMGV